MQHWLVPLAPAGRPATSLDLTLVAGPEVPADDSWLSEREREILATFRLPARRSDWRLGRWTARQAFLARARRDDEEPSPELSSLAVLAAPDGAPELLRDRSPTAVALSLSHRNGWGFAAIGDGGLALGCDLEWIEPRSEAFVRDYLTPGEQSALARWPTAERSLAANLAWSGKECALKALREGLRRDTRSVEVDLDQARLALSSKEEWNTLSLTASGLAPLGGGWRREGDLLLSWVAAR